MKRLISFLFFASLVAIPLHDAEAQAPDVREVRPIVMLLVDTSGSMDWMETSNDLPDCGRGERNRFHLVQEAMTGSWDDRDWSCDRNLVPNGSNQQENGILDVYLDRMVFGMMTFDNDYDVEETSSGDWSYGPPAAWDDGDNRNNIICEEGCQPSCRDECTRTCRQVCTRRKRNGSCYSWAWEERCSTTCVEVCDGTPVCGFGCRSANGDPRGADYVNVGARNANATSGALLSIGDGETLTPEQQNANIQDELLSIEPSGGTPIAGMLSDLGWFMENDPDIVDDPFAECRGHYAILLSDGLPNTDRRTGCEASGQSCPYLRPVDEAAALCELNGAGECTGVLDGLYAIGMDLSSSNGLSFLNDIADVGGTEEAYFADDQATLVTAFASALDAISANSTSRTAPAFSGGGASSSNSASQFNAGFIVGRGEGGWAGKLERTRFVCNNDLVPEAQPIANNDRFHELLDNQPARTLYTVVPSDVDDYADHLIGDIDDAPEPIPFEDNATGNSGNGNGNRGNGGLPAACRVNSPGGGNNGNGNGNGNNDSHAVEDGLELEAFSLANGNVSADLLGVDRDVRDDVINWVHGTSGRSSAMGAIYHSSPVIVGAPSMDIPDESYNLFRRRDDVANRPTVLYVGSSDGVLHAFLAEDWEDPASGASMDAGEELWGFVPPMLLQKLDEAMVGNQFMVDGTAVVRDIFFRREAGADPSGDIYHTVLIMGMRGGAAGYIALDVTDPLNPEFMWQFADGANMGATYGMPAMGQILVEVSGSGAGGLSREERAIVLLPAGSAEDVTSTDPDGRCGAPEDADGDGEFDKPIGCPGQGRGTPPVNQGTLNARDNQRCWTPRGRSLYFLDPATGELITLLDDTVFNAPLTGGMALFTGDTGTIATRAFLTDADGMMWRVDFSDPDYSNWDAEPFFDLFHGKNDVGIDCGGLGDDGIVECNPGAMDAEPAYYAPILTTDPDGNVTVIQGTGDLDTLDDPRAVNRVVSVTEVLNFNATTGEAEVNPDTGNRADWRLNWEVTLDRGEQVTGPLQLFGGNVYFATFDAREEGSNSCDFGTSQLWAVDYLLNEETVYCDSISDEGCPSCGSDDGGCSEIELPIGAFPAAGSTFTRELWPNRLENQLVLGVGITQRQTCSDLQSDITDPFLAGYFRTRIAEQGAGGFELSFQTSGGGEANAGGSIPSQSIELTPPEAYTRVSGWASAL